MRTAPSFTSQARPDGNPPDADGASPSLITVTLGDNTTQRAWTRTTTYTWPEFATLLASHQVGAKDGTCIVPATLSGQTRGNRYAQRIGVAMLDSDSGAPLAEIQQAVSARGWCAVISSTHSHMGNQTKAKRGAFETWCRNHGLQLGDADAPERFLIEDRHMRPEIAAGASIATMDDVYVVLHHQPCPRFRVALPLARPWVADAYETSAAAIAAWRSAYAALAAALKLAHDHSCSDPARLFYLPRYPAGGAVPETAILDGEWLDIFALPQVQDNTRSGAQSGSRRAARQTNNQQREQQQDIALATDFGLGASISFTDPDTGKCVDLRRWAAREGQHFLLASALRARSPQVLRSRLAEGRRQHTICPNANAHTLPDADFATFVCDAGDGEGTKGFVIHCRHAHCDGRDRLLFLRQMLEQGWLTISDLQKEEFSPGRPAEKPLIRVAGGDLPEAVQAAEEALIAAGQHIYQRGSFIVRPGVIRLGVGGSVERSSLQIIELEDQALAEVMTSVATWQRFDKRSEDWADIDAPLKVATILRQRKGHWRLPVLAGILTAPTLRSDGSVLDTPGYDEATGLLLATRNTRFPPLPERPSKAQAMRALQKLLDLISGFSFVDPASRSVALSGMLSSPIRRSLRTVPLHGYSAPVAGSGKSLLVDISSVITTGRVAGVIAQGKTEEELEKRLGALLLAGEQVIAIDNCEAPLGGEFLCQLLTQERVRCRILGRSEAPELPSNSFVTATGNNLTVIGDMTRRTIMCQLDPNVERPELRTFDRDPLADARSSRPELLVAALTILRAYHVAGRPNAPLRLGSFETWSDWVRGALLWLDQA